MEQLKTIKEQLLSQIQAQMADLRCVDTHELGEVIDMVKDLAQAEYYCQVYKTMKDAEEEKNLPQMNNYYFSEPDHSSRDADREYGKMYYPNDNGAKYYSSMYRSNPYYMTEDYYEKEFPMQYIRDEREGRSPIKRKMYMESKTTNADSSKAMKELEGYMQDLTTDMMELLDKASPEEKTIVQKKINTLATKMQNV